jgi:hypothetical protein
MFLRLVFYVFKMLIVEPPLGFEPRTFSLQG